MSVEANIEALNEDFASATPEDLIAWACARFGQRIALASSFGAEDVALIAMSAKIQPGIRVITLDTGRLNEETYEVMERIRSKYPVTWAPYFPEAKDVEDILRRKGPYSFRLSVPDRMECCRIRKVEPLRLALQGLDAWITGLRRGQSSMRAGIKRIELDRTHQGVLKINPLADWTSERVWAYIKENGVPYNRLHDAGYPSIGCAPCTRPIGPNEDARAGRWWWEDAGHKECGIHAV